MLSRGERWLVKHLNGKITSIHSQCRTVATKFLHSMGLGVNTAFFPLYHSVLGAYAFWPSIFLWSFAWLGPAHTSAIWGQLVAWRLWAGSVCYQESCPAFLEPLDLIHRGLPTLPPWNTEGLMQVWPADKPWDFRALQGTACSQCDLRL